MSESVKQVTDASFASDVLAAERPVLVDFFADWCGPCHALAPALERIASNRAGEVSVVKLDVDANPEATLRFGIKGLPTLMLFKGGQPVASQVGVLPKARLEAWLADAV
ncbi:MAG: thioredoxin [Geminicoccaceae bacterium]